MLKTNHLLNNSLEPFLHKKKIKKKNDDIQLRKNKMILLVLNNNFHTKDSSESYVHVQSFQGKENDEIKLRHNTRNFIVDNIESEKKRYIYIDMTFDPQRHSCKDIILNVRTWKNLSEECNSDFDWVELFGVYLDPPNLQYVVSNINSKADSNIMYLRRFQCVKMKW